MVFGIDDIVGAGAGILGGLVGLGGESGGDIANKYYGNLPMTFAPEDVPYTSLAGMQQFQTPEELQAQLVQENPELVNKQMLALDELKQIQAQGFTPAQQRAFTTASRAAGTQAQGEQGALMADLAAKGRSGSGIEAALREMAIQAANDRASQQMMAQAEAEAAARQNANTAMLTGAGQVRSQDLAAKGTNADILNQFAQLNSKNRQDAKNANVNLANTTATQNWQAQNAAAQQAAVNRNTAKQLEVQNRLNTAATKTQAEVGHQINPQNAAIGSMIGQAGGQIASAIGGDYQPYTLDTNKTKGVI